MAKITTAEKAAQDWLAGSARLAGPHGVTAEQEGLMRLGFEQGFIAAQIDAERIDFLQEKARDLCFHAWADRSSYTVTVNGNAYTGGTLRDAIDAAQRGGS